MEVVESMGPNRIFRLPQEVVNRIAAGEIIQRPVSALKEMLENSLDAGATQINITVKEGGNKFLQIQDNGSGIQEADFPLLCERHATSKLQAFEDLEKIDTLGFRGEALASISFVGHFSVTTMTKDSPHGFKISYRDGKMESGGPKPCAAVQGTTITVEDLFYNVPTRKKALKSSSDEFSRILDIVGSYAMYKPEVGFTVKKQGESRADLHTLGGAQRLDNIRNIFGGSVARNVVEITSGFKPGQEKSPFKPAANGIELQEQDVDIDLGDLEYEAKGFISNADYSGKKTVFILFINGRPVDCNPLKRAIEVMYGSVLPKASKPWIFLDLRLPGRHVDVNLHPTKREVGFLHQERLIEALVSAIEQKLLTSNTQRTFTQTQLPSSMTNKGSTETQNSDPLVSTRRDKAGGDHKLIRTDSRARTLDSFMRPTQNSPQPEMQGGSLSAQGMTNAVKRRGADRGTVRLRDQWEMEERGKQLEHARSVKQKPNPPISELESIQELLAEITKQQHTGLSEVIKSHTFVGMADEIKALIQHGTRLYLANTTRITQEMFYQQVLSRFENFQPIELSTSINVREIALIALESELNVVEEDGVSKSEIADLILKLLTQKSELLHECFGIKIGEGGDLQTLPQLIEGYIPDTDYLPSFILRLAREVNWIEEKQCFRDVAMALAEFYSWKARLKSNSKEDTPMRLENLDKGPKDIEMGAENPINEKEEENHDENESKFLDADRSWTIQHVIYPALRGFWKPSQSNAQDGSMIELTRLEHLYKIFERC